ncbi:MAG: polyribonucleotide nucleotidyltransferase [Flavobacteriaceae bacterium]|nr:polyribonucleotide nucleotidyltransferase [Flavobacteriaceae bacterium]
MIPKVFKQDIDLGDGRTISIETGKLAKQADGSVVVRMGDTMLLATVVAATSIKPDMNFLPLTVDYREKFAAAGRYPGGFFKREARPSTEEILTMRLVDRVLRPLFPSDYHAETQVMIQLMSYEKGTMPDALAALAASAAIALTDIPFECPVSEVRVGRINGEFIVNPTREQLEVADIDLMVGATEKSVTMVEGEMDEVAEADMIAAIKVAHEAIKIQCKAQEALAVLAGKVFETRDYEKEATDEDIASKVNDFAYDKIYAIAKQGSSKKERTEKFGQIKEDLLASFSEEELEEKADLIKTYFAKTHKKAVRDLTLNEGLRLDGRQTTEIRPIWSEVGYLPSTHGSAVFTRGETQALATVTLGTSREASKIDLPTYEGEDNFYLHYNFPPFCTGEAKPLRGTSRREIGHGNLAQRALKLMMPSDCPYTVRVVSEVLESNGSSSMATVCAGTLALMDAGIQLIRPVSGIAMGLIADEEAGNYAVLSDILGDEDHLGDMDFKVTGTEKGITACQMDIKVKGLSYDVLEQALSQAREGRLHILDKINETIKTPNAEVKPNAPKIIKLEVAKEFIGAIIGPGGKVIQELQASTETTIVIEEAGEIGVVEILGVDQEKIDTAIAAIKNLTFKPTVGDTYNGKVVKILDFGAVLEIVPGKEMLLHVSEMAWERTENAADICKEGDMIEVKYLGLDSRTKKQKISRKALLPRPERKPIKKD